MPKVGSRYFPYSVKGRRAARRYAKKKGLKMHTHTKIKYRGHGY